MKALIRFNEAVCPRCLKKLCRIRKGGRASGVELWCKTCRAPVLLECGDRHKL